MVNKIYLILGGEDEKKRPRCKKLLELIRIGNLKEEKYLVIASGLAWFRFETIESESSRIAKYLIEKNIPKENIILEQESIDTLGNLIFSYKIIEQIIRQNTLENNNIEIILITEGFHLNRAKKLFLKIYSELKNINSNLKFSFESANSMGISRFYWKRKLNIIIEKIKRKIKKDEDINEYKNKTLKLGTKYLIDYILLDLILTDFDIFRLKNYNEFKNYLFSLPIYNQKYNPKNKYLIQFSFYAKTINKLISNRNN